MEWTELIIYLAIFSGSLGSFVAIFFKFFKKYWNKVWSGKPKKTVILANSWLGIITLIFFIWVAPVTANLWFYQGIVLNWYYFVIPILSFILLFYIWRWRFGKHSNDYAKKVTEGISDGRGKIDAKQAIKNFQSFARVAGRRMITSILAVVVLNIVWILLANNFVDWATYHVYAKSEKREALIKPSPDGLRYTPREVAFVDLENYISLATEDTRLESTRPIYTKGNWGYITPVIPDGVPAIFTKKNPGFLYYNDSGKSEELVERIDQEFQCGEGMYWLDSLKRQAYLKDFTAKYEKPHYVDISAPEEEMKLVAVMPKIEYAFGMLPHWTGSVIVDDECNVKDYSVEELKEHEKYSKLWVAPIELARHYVEIQNYAAGFMAGFDFWRVDGKLEIPQLPGNNQFPHIQIDEAGNTDFLVVTKAEGGGSGMYRAYYYDAGTFELTHYEFPQTGKKKVYGPSAALQRIPNIPGYNWYRKSENGTESGNVIAIEPVFIPQDDGTVFWKFTITNKDNAGVSGSAIADATNPKKINSFTDKQRPYYEAWLRGGEASREQMLRDAIQSAQEALSIAKSNLDDAGGLL